MGGSGWVCCATSSASIPRAVPHCSTPRTHLNPAMPGRRGRQWRWPRRRRSPGCPSRRGWPRCCCAACAGPISRIACNCQRRRRRCILRPCWYHPGCCQPSNPRDRCAIVPCGASARPMRRRSDARSARHWPTHRASRRTACRSASSITTRRPQRRDCWRRWRGCGAISKAKFCCSTTARRRTTSIISPVGRPAFGRGACGCSGQSTTSGPDRHAICCSPRFARSGSCHSTTT